MDPTNPDRRGFLRAVGVGSLALAASRYASLAEDPQNSMVIRIHNIPPPDFSLTNRHTGVEALLFTLASQGSAFYKTKALHPLGNPAGLIAADDVVVIKVNAQWKYRGCTNSDVVRGVIQRLLEHPDGFTGEIIIADNGQGRGSLNCDTTAGCDGGTPEVHANAENEAHSFSWLVRTLFHDARVSEKQLDKIRTVTVPDGDHKTEGFRKVASTSYACFNSTKGNRVELREGLWDGTAYDSTRLKWINIPVLKDHKDLNATACTKHMYGLFTTHNVGYDFHSPSLAGGNMGDFYCHVRPMTLNILDAIWVSHASLCGFPAETTTRVNALVGGFDPIALDAWATRRVLFPISGDPAHDPDSPGFLRSYLLAARDRINSLGGLAGHPVTMDPRQTEVAHVDPHEIQIRVQRRGDDIELFWFGPGGPYRVERDTDPEFPAPLILAQGLGTAEWVDHGAATPEQPVFYYRVASGNW